MAATFTAVDSAASVEDLTDDATVVTDRLRALGDTGASAAVRGQTIEVRGTKGLPEPAGALLAHGLLQVRSVLCPSSPYTPPTSGTGAPSAPSGCSSDHYSLQAPNLTVNESTGTTNLDSIPPDPLLAAYPSSSATYDDAHPESSVLVPAAGDGGVRYLLGPAELNSSAVASARAVFQNPQWIVDVTFTGAGAEQWNAVTRKYFHELIGIDVDGQALSVPIVQPTQSTFTTFGARTQISGDFTRTSARQLAADLNSGPLATPLQV